jgi:hypothetical protein
MFEMAYSKGKKPISREDYIEKYAEVAIVEMNIYNIPASITLAQGCLESGNGNSTLARKSNNHFGIKCNNSWDGSSVLHDDDEDDECFRKYPNVWESFRDHSKFLLNNQRYSPLFKLKIKDYKGWAKGLKKAGYATDPKYSTSLIAIIEQHKLYEFDTYYKKDFASAKGKRRVKKSKSIARERRDIDNFSISAYSRRSVSEINGRKYVIAQKEDSYQRIAEEFRLKGWEVCNFNDVQKVANPPLGSIVFIQSKRSKAAKGRNIHVLKAGEGMWQVSQKYGVRLKSLYRRNRMKHGDPLEVGQKIWLTKRKPAS